MQKTFRLEENRVFNESGMKRYLVHDSASFKIIGFNLRAGQEFPVHAHDDEGEVSILVLEGEGEFLGKDEAAIPARAGDVLISPIREPHGVRATRDMRLVVHIAPPV